MKPGRVVLVATVVVVVPLLAFYLSHDSAIRSTFHPPGLTRLGELDDGCRQYKQDTKYYPGQLNSNVIGRGKAQLTGAQVLARAMFTKTLPDGTAQYPTSEYATYKEGDLIDANGRTGVISDGHRDDPMPVLYYPARFGVDGVAQFVEADNAAHTDGHKGGSFREFITDGSFGREDCPYNEGEFLLITAGPDRKYFTWDDYKNWAK